MESFANVFAGFLQYYMLDMTQGHIPINTHLLHNDLRRTVHGHILIILIKYEVRVLRSSDRTTRLTKVMEKAAILVNSALRSIALVTLLITRGGS